MMPPDQVIPPDQKRPRSNEFIRHVPRSDEFIWYYVGFPAILGLENWVSGVSLADATQL
jgi:hypothetical protein